jgi:hypothetical protein
MPGPPIQIVMTRCDHCGSETALPFTCQHCGGKYCADCRLPPNHNCTGIGSWNSKPRPAVGMSYSRGGGVSATGGIAVESRRAVKPKQSEGIPYLKIMIVVIVLILIGLGWLMLSGFSPG